MQCKYKIQLKCFHILFILKFPTGQQAHRLLCEVKKEGEKIRQVFIQLAMPQGQQNQLPQITGDHLFNEAYTHLPTLLSESCIYSE